MAATEVMHETHDRQAQRRRPFSTWVKKLTTFKQSLDSDRPKRSRKTKRILHPNNPYPESGFVGDVGEPATESACSVTTGRSSQTSLGRADRNSTDDTPPETGARSFAGTDNEGSHSIMAPSHGASSLAGTNRTIGGAVDSRRGGDSTFSSPAPSVRSLTTTLTTIHSMTPNGNGNGSNATSHNTHHGPNGGQSIQFSQPFPTTSPASAIPAHLAPTGNPTSYTAATANNLWTDNASILTLASSSKQRRRRSMDTDASVRALAPSSLWGGSRESLPLSVLSANIESGMPTTPVVHTGGSRLGAERASIYSATGVTPTLASERNSYYAGKGDGASVRSGRLGHGRTDSVGGGTTTLAGSQLTSTMEMSDDKTGKGDTDKASLATEKD